MAVAIDGANRHGMKLTEPTLEAMAVEKPAVTDENPQNVLSVHISYISGD